MIDERTDLPEGTEVELQLVKVADAFAEMAPEDRDELEEAIERASETLKTATTSAPENSWHRCEPRTLFPLAVGNIWTFAVTGTSTDCPAGTHQATIAATATAGGESAFDFRDYCAQDMAAYLRVSDGEVLQYQAEWARSLAAPVQEGYSWASTTNYQLTWHYVGAVTVSAGTFQNCWQRLNMSSPGDVLGSRTYCPGVGPVKATYSDNEATLTSYLLK